MARKAKKTKPEAEATEVEVSPVETPPVDVKPARGAKTAAIKLALTTHKNKSPKEIAELVTASGITTTAGQVSNVKSLLAARKKALAAPAPAPTAEAAPVVPKDAVSLGLLQKAKKLAAQLGGIKEAKAAIDALAQILD